MKVCDLCKARFSDDLRVCPLDGSPLTLVADALIGQTVAGRYIVIEKLGAGGMGAVYRAHHEIVGRDVALKFLSPELSIDPTARKRFLREARATNRIAHDNIISITDFGETAEGLVYLVMEFLVGSTLGQAITQARGPLELRRAFHIGMQIAGALGRAHELGVLHRDIKPDNVFLVARDDAPDFVKLLDFGLAHMRGELRLTASGSVLGTVEYMAPEHARGQASGPGVDLYSLGCLLFEMVTGRLPFIGNTADAILAQHLNASPLPPSHFTRAVPPALDALVLSLLAKDPTARPRNAHVVFEVLRALLEEQAETKAPTPRAQGQITQKVAPASTSGGHRTLRGESAFWDERVAFFIKLADETHEGRDNAPPWVREVIAQLELSAGVMRTAREQIAEATARSNELEQQGRETQLRIGRALDELLRDETAATQRIDRAHDLAASLELERTHLQSQIDERRRAVTMGRVDRTTAEALRELGASAGRWLAIDDDLVEATRGLNRMAREREDLAFQIAQLKGRLGTASVEQEHELDELRRHTHALSQRIYKSVEEIVRISAPLVAHLMTHPRAHAQLRSESFEGAPPS